MPDNRSRKYGVKRRGTRFTASPYIPSLGKTAWVGTFDDEDEALRAAIARFDELKRVAPSKETVRSFADRWTRDYPRPKESTNENYRYMAKLFVDQFGDVRLREFSRLDARRFAKEKPGAAAKMRSMFADALDEGLIEKNPFVGLRLGGEGSAQQKKAFEVLSEPEVERLIEIAAKTYEETSTAALIAIAAYAGMRQSEIFGLAWEDIDRMKGEIHVERQIYKRRITSPKNGRPRTIILPPAAAAVLDSIDRETPVMVIDEHGKERAIDFVFRNRNGKAMSANALSGTWNPVKVAFGRRKLRFHDLRHFCATYFLEMFRAQGMEGSSETAIQLGHTDDGVLIRERYGHASDDLARERIKKLFDKPTPLHGVEDDEEAANG